jgi:hypothetical protein
VAILRRLYTAFKERSGPAAVEFEVCAFPPPFQRMVAVNSDVEYTSWPAQLTLLRSFAEAGLETAFSYWFFNDPMATWRLFEDDGRPSRHAQGAFALARAGLLDTLHSFGGQMNGTGCHFDRAAILRGYEQIEANGVRTLVYSNHGTIKDVQNVGGAWCESHGDLNYQKGDVPGHASYHLDRTLEHGVRFFWVDIDRARTVTRFRPLANGEADGLFVVQECRDGRRILRFRRTDTNVDPVSSEFHRQVDNVLAGPAGGYSVIYTHLGVLRDGEGRPYGVSAPFLSAPAREGLQALRTATRRGEVLVTTTERLLRHAFMMAAHPLRIELRDDAVMVEFSRDVEFHGMRTQLEWDDYLGFALRCRRRQRCFAKLGAEMRELTNWNIRGVEYAGLPWRPLPCASALEEASRVT